MIALFGDLGFLVTLFGAVLTAYGALLPFWKIDPKNSRRISIALIALGCLITVVSDGYARWQSNADKADLNGRLARSASREQKIQQQAAQTYSAAEAITKQASTILAKVDANLLTTQQVDRSTTAVATRAKQISRQASTIMSSVQRTMTVTQQVAQGTSVIAKRVQTTLTATQKVEHGTSIIESRANDLQQSAAGELDQLARLESPLKDLLVSYTVSFPINDPHLGALKQLLISAAKVYEAGLSTKWGAGTYAPPVLTYGHELFDAISPNDVGYRLLRSMDIDIELFRPPFPKKPFYINSMPEHRDTGEGPDFEFQTTLAQTAIDDGVAPPVGFVKSGYTIQFEGDPSEDLVDPKAIRVHAFRVPASETWRSGHLVSVHDLPGSMMLVHLRYGPMSPFVMPLLTEAKLLTLTIWINGTDYGIRMTKMHSGTSQVFGNWYELDIPAGVDFEQFLRQP